MEIKRKPPAGWQPKARSPDPSLPYPITLHIADSASEEYLATTTGPQPDEGRFLFWDNSGTQSTAKRVFEIGVPMPVMPAFFGTPLGEAASLVFRLAREGDSAESRIVEDI
jgi:hypothetical protein